MTTKQECIGHVAKRVGSRLRKLKNKTEKGLGKLGLNDATIDKLQNYCGIAIRGNIGNTKATKQSIYAAWCHVTSSKEKQFHDHCLEVEARTALHVPGKGPGADLGKKLRGGLCAGLQQ